MLRHDDDPPALEVRAVAEEDGQREQREEDEPEYVEPKRVAAVVVALVVTYDIIVRALPEFEGNALVLEEPGERLAIFRPDLRDVTLTSRSIACPLAARVGNARSEKPHFTDRLRLLMTREQGTRAWEKVQNTVIY